MEPIIPELLKSVVGSIVRWALTGAFAFLVSKGIIKPEDSELLIVGIAGGGAILVWSLWQKYKSRLQVVTALALPPSSTDEDLKRAMKSSTNNVSAWALLLFVVLIPLGLTACGDDQQKAIASSIDRIAVAVNDAREVRDELFVGGLIEREQAYKFTQGLYKINTATKVFHEKAKTYQTTGNQSEEAKADLTKLATDITDAVSELVNNGTFGVKNPASQQKINAVVSSIRQVTLALLDTVKAAKVKSQPVQQGNAGLLAIVPMILLTFRKVTEWIARERARTGKTTEEIFEEAGIQLEANDAALLDDLAKYAPPSE